MHGEAAVYDIKADLFAAKYVTAHHFKNAT